MHMHSPPVRPNQGCRLGPEPIMNTLAGKPQAMIPRAKRKQQCTIGTAVCVDMGHIMSTITTSASARPAVLPTLGAEAVQLRRLELAPDIDIFPHTKSVNTFGGYQLSNTVDYILSFNSNQIPKFVQPFYFVFNISTYLGTYMPRALLRKGRGDTLPSRPTFGGHMQICQSVTKGNFRTGRLGPPIGTPG